MQLAGVNYKETFAFVIKLVLLQMLLTFAPIHNVHLKHWNVVAVFLNGEQLEKVFIRQLHDFNFEVGKVLCLKRVSLQFRSTYAFFLFAS